MCASFELITVPEEYKAYGRSDRLDPPGLELMLRQYSLSKGLGVGEIPDGAT